MQSTNLNSEIVIANGVEYNVWREVNTFITWGNIMAHEPIRYTESNIISYKEMRYSLAYKNRKIIIDPVDEAEVPRKLVSILKDVAESAIRDNGLLSSNPSGRLN